MGVVLEHTAGPEPGSGEQVAHRIPAPHDDGGEHLSPASADEEAGLAASEATTAMATRSSMMPRRVAISTTTLWTDGRELRGGRSER
jgi:hypothetical protein